MATYHKQFCVLTQQTVTEVLWTQIFTLGKKFSKQKKSSSTIKVGSTTSRLFAAAHLGEESYLNGRYNAGFWDCLKRIYGKVP